MIVIADTSAINYLIQIGEAQLLGNLYGQVILPPGNPSASSAKRIACSEFTGSCSQLDLGLPRAGFASLRRLLKPWRELMKLSMRVNWKPSRWRSISTQISY